MVELAWIFERRMDCPSIATLVRNHTLWGTVSCYVINSNKPVFIFGFGISYQMDMEIVQLAMSWTVDFISEMAPLIKRLILRYFDSRFKGLTLLPSCDNEQINSFGTITTYTSMRLLRYIDGLNYSTSGLFGFFRIDFTRLEWARGLEPARDWEKKKGTSSQFFVSRAVLLNLFI